MCTIVGFTGKQNAAPILMEGLKKLEYRGYDSAGIAVDQNGVITVSKVSGRIANLCEKTADGKTLPGFSGIGHTRWETRGRPADANAHPHMSCDGCFSVVHNGIVENYSVFYIGRNTDYAVALEGALKMKEISYTHAEAYAAGELKHGTIALIDEGQSVIAICCNSRIAEKTMSNIVDVKARSAQVLAPAIKGNCTVLAQANDVIYISDLDPLFHAGVEIIPLQLLTYYVAKENGCDIDNLKNLAKSVIVE